MIGMRRTISHPGWPASNRNADSPLRVSSDVRAIRMKCCAAPAPVMNHLRPLTTQVSPFLVAVVSMADGSDPDPGAGSVIAKADRTCPSIIGCSQRSFWASVPTLFSTVMLPSSGAAQLKQTGPKMDRFISS